MVLSHNHFDLLDKPVLERVVFQPPLKADATMHDEACFLYAVNGESILFGETETESLCTQEGVLMKCGSYLNKWSGNAANKPFEAIAVHFYPEVLRFIYGNQLPEFLRPGKGTANKSINKLQADAILEKYIESLIFYFENPDLISQELIILKVKEIILLLINSGISANIKSILQDLFNPQESEFKSIIESHLYHDLSLEELAILSNLSLSSFKRRFTEVYADSPGKYIKRRRLNHAAELLKKTSQRIADIAFSCGFNDPAHFTKCFHLQYGCSPSVFRKNLG